jgi:hypothetical protein
VRGFAFAGLLIGILLLFGAGATYLIVTRKDAGFLPAPCGASEGWPCEVLPVSIVVDGSADDWDPVVQNSIHWWVASSSVTVWFQYGGRVDAPIQALDPVITVSVDSAQTNPHGDAIIRYGSHCEIRRVEIRFPPADTVIPSARARVVEHELGHALELGHDTIEASIMYWEVARALPGPFLLTGDRERLRRRGANCQ